MENKKQTPRIVITLIALGTMLAAFNHCVIEPPKKATKSSGRSLSSESTGDTTEAADSPQSPNPSPSPTVPTPTTPTLSQGQQFFQDTVSPAFQNQCMTCHTEPVNNPPLPGPLTIFNYDQMKEKLLNGGAANNELIRKVQGQISHAGGNQCASNPTICQNLQDWYAQEIGQPTTPPAPTNGVSGMVSIVSALGKVTGYAGNPGDPSETVYVNFYLDGPAGTGILLNNAPMPANQAGFNGGISGNHAFTYYIPVLYRDGQNYQLYAYAVNEDNGEEVALQGSPYAFSAYVSSILGYNYYVNTVKPLLDNRCSACHAFSYDQNFSSLLTPSPNNGGTERNNEMINMPSGGNMGVSHPGGNLCGSKDNSPCVEIQQWWQNEFN